MEAANAITLFELKPWHTYALACDVTCVDGHFCPKGTVLRHKSAMLHLNGKGATVQGTDAEGRVVEFTLRDWRTQAWFVPRVRNEAYADRAKLAKVLSWTPGMEPVCRILTRGPSSHNWGALRNDADALSGAALELERSLPDAAKALAEESLSLYSSWMAQATSGGEGTAMEREVRPRMQRMEGLILGPR